MTALRIANTVLAVLICAVTIKWALVFFKPDNVEPLPAKAVAPVERTKSKPEQDTVKSLPLFTPVKKTEPVSIVKPVVPSLNITDLELKGIFANTENPKLSIAIIKVKGASEVPAQVGDEIKPGVTLNGVGANYVILLYEGELTRLGFPGRVAGKGTPGNAIGSITPNAIEPSSDDNNAPAFSRSPSRPRQRSAAPSLRQLPPKPNVRPGNKRKGQPIVVAPAFVTPQAKAEIKPEPVSTPLETATQVTEEMQAEPVQTVDNTPAAEPAKTKTPPKTDTTPDTTTNTTTSTTTGTTPDTSTNNGSDNQQNQGNDGGGQTGGSNGENIPDFMNDNDGAGVDPGDVPDFMKDDQGTGTDVPAFMQ